MRIPLMILPLRQGIRLTDRWRGIWHKILKLLPKIRKDMVEADLDLDPEEYIGASILSAVLTGLTAFIIFYALLALLGADEGKILLTSVLTGGSIFLLFIVALLTYPGIIAGKKAETIDKDLVFALKDMLLEVSSGASAYSALAEVANSGYGLLSEEIETVVKKANVGVPVEEALEELALKTRSEHLKSSIWQIVNALKSGSSLEGILRELVKDLTFEQKIKIRNYAQELNVMILAYMLFAVVIPTIATTIIIILGPFMGVSMGPRIFYIIIPVCFFMQIALMEFIKSRRPVTYV
ncbi:type II secretion system F family protein [Candidatus Altiarchaeota archaeon]